MRSLSVRPKSLRGRLTLLATGLVALVLLVSGLALVQAQQQLLTRGLDEALVQRADNLQDEALRLTPGSVLPGEGDREDSFVQLVGSGPSVLAASDNARDLPPLATARSSIRSTAVRNLSRHEFRVLSRHLDGGRALVVAKNLDDVQESVRVLQSSLAVAVPVMLGLLALLSWWLAGRVLRPVEAIRAEVAEIGGAELQRRVAVPGAEDEVSRLARTMNAMLARVEQATCRQREFVADASHELRSPLNRLRSALEVAQVHPDSMPNDKLLGDLLTDTVELQQLVDDLLFLARAESGADAARAQLIDLDDLLLVEAQRLRANTHLEVDTRGVAPGRVSGDPRQLARAIGNLTDNAVRHARSRICLTLTEMGEDTELTVTDDGPGIPEDAREVVFARFTRLQVARSREDGGSGLGLAIVQDIMHRHGGTAVITGALPTGTTVRLAFPRAW